VICEESTCKCSSSNEVFCDGKCIAKDLCECNKDKPPNWALSDVKNCLCQGPCKPGEYCNAIQGCQCDSSLHNNDSFACSCRQCLSSSRDGSYACMDGRYVCNVDKGYVCDSGACICNYQANAQNANNCGCKGPCPRSATPGSSPMICDGGACRCPVGT